MFTFRRTFKHCLIATTFKIFLFESVCSSEPIVPDRTLGTTVTTEVTPEGDVREVDGGTRRGNNLFHGFERFNVPTGSVANFTLTEGVERAFVRIGGGEASQIFGNITADRPADFYFLNPQGFLFGPEARVNVLGSFAFLGSDRLDFADGGEFSLTSTEDSVLSISGPIGFHATQGSRIEVRGMGHDFLLDGESGGPIPFVSDAGLSDNGLRTEPGQQVSLAAGEIVFDGGVLTVPAGTIAVTAATGEMRFVGQHIALTPEATPGSLTLRDRALLDVSGKTNGNVFVTAGTIDILDGSHIWGQSENGGPGMFQIEATEQLNVSGVDEVTGLAFEEVFGSVSSITVVSFAGETAALEVTAPSIEITAGGEIANFHFSEGSGGQTDIQTNNLFIAGASVDFPGPFPSQVVSTTVAQNPEAVGSLININAESISIVDGGTVASTAALQAAGGDVVITANDLEITGVRTFQEVDDATGDSNESAFDGSVSALTFGPANGGDIALRVDNILVGGGSSIASITSSSGSAGDISIISNSVQVTGFSQAQGTFLASFIGARGRDFLNLPEDLSALEEEERTGDSGNVFVDAETVMVDNSGVINVGNDGVGNSGHLSITARSVSLENQGQLEGSTFVGTGGEIVVISDTLELDSGRITTSSFFDADGGNIDLQSTIIIARNNSEISATAVIGDGGTISFNTEGILLFPDTIVTIESENGRDGIVSFNAVTNFSSEVELPVEPLSFDPKVLVSSKCSPGGGGKFTTAGDREELFRRHGLVASIEEATGIARDGDGEVVLVSQCPLAEHRPS